MALAIIDGVIGCYWALVPCVGGGDSGLRVCSTGLSSSATYEYAGNCYTIDTNPADPCGTVVPAAALTAVADCTACDLWQLTNCVNGSTILVNPSSIPSGATTVNDGTYCWTVDRTPRSGTPAGGSYTAVTGCADSHCNRGCGECPACSEMPTAVTVGNFNHVFTYCGDWTSACATDVTTPHWDNTLVRSPATCFTAPPGGANTICTWTYAPKNDFPVHIIFDAAGNCGYLNGASLTCGAGIINGVFYPLRWVFTADFRFDAGPGTTPCTVASVQYFLPGPSYVGTYTKVGSSFSGCDCTLLMSTITIS